MMETRRIPLTVPMTEYLRLKHEADLAEKSMNQYVLSLLRKRKVIIIPQARQLYAEVYRIRQELEHLKAVISSEDIQGLVERVDKLCRFCDTFLVDTIKSIN